MQHWNSYWQKTRTLNSFAEGEQGMGYTGEIAAFWQSVFSAQPKTATILDLATGNGGLAVLALQTSADFQVCASDAADIAPLKLFSKHDAVYTFLEKIQFFGNMASEQLTFADGQFDLVVSQFGFEYAQSKPALSQLHRVLKTGGQFVALIHHSESFVTQDCKHGTSVLPYFIAEQGLLEQVRQFARYCQQLAGLDSLDERQQYNLKQRSDFVLQRFIECRAKLSDDQQDWFNLLAKDIVAVISNWRNASERAVDELFQSMSEFYQRLNDQLASAWDTPQAHLIEQHCTVSWTRTTMSCLTVNGDVLCWVLKLEK